MSYAHAKMHAPERGHWNCTNLKFMDVTYLWTINNLSFAMAENIFESSIFSPDENTKIKWKLYFKCDFPSRDKILNLFLNLVSSDKYYVIAAYTIYVVKDKGELSGGVKKGPCKFFSGVSNDYIEFYPFSYNDSFRFDRITFRCEIRIADHWVTESGQKRFETVMVPEFRLSHRIETLFNNPKFSDVILSVGHPSQSDNRECYAHKAILAASSPVFSAMFEHDMKENNENVILIEDVDPNVVEEMLRFIYTDTVPKLKEMTTSLLAVADKYALERLKALCEQQFCHKLQVETACNILVLADLYNAKQLEEAATEFITHYLNSIQQTEGWKNMADKYPSLADRFSEHR
ncbi:speckle-type POZ protein B-like [Centruroides sculpturatus]|uniref:speckle-type POZ protein B-like n=1 Tax=Centruroides sculpturatus TaxID=218467 RepID=UPI000C6D792A|nr:speckle-type POZ protein B-like [Centruroides sculpturatus]XP_023231142.1 speckle-type POZ protein B-like [Centruroides sculpturatus]